MDLLGPGLTAGIGAWQDSSLPWYALIAAARVGYGRLVRLPPVHIGQGLASRSAGWLTTHPACRYRSTTIPSEQIERASRWCGVLAVS